MKVYELQENKDLCLTRMDCKLVEPEKENPEVVMFEKQVMGGNYRKYSADRLIRTRRGVIAIELKLHQAHFSERETYCIEYNEIRDLITFEQTKRLIDNLV